MNSKLIKATTSSLVLGAALIGCTTSTKLSRPLASGAGSASNYRHAEQAHERAVKAIRSGDLAGGIAAMEDAVAFSPQDVGYRKTLAELYLKTGRFTSAETTYADVVRLNPGDSKAAFFLAVSQLAQGRTAAALVQLSSMDSSVDSADLGLAYALAGQTRRALSLLEPAAREVTATARVRQNLALAYALAGDWKNARLTAEQDVSPSDLNRRLEQWAALASVSAPETRVATMLGVSPANDPGQPARLALAPVASSGVASAEVSDGAESAAAARADSIVVPVPAIPAPAEQTVSGLAASSEPLPSQPPAHARPLVAAPALLQTNAVAGPRSAGLSPAKDVGKTASSRFVVQLGAFRTQAQVDEAWARLSRRHSFISRYVPLSTSVTVSGKGVFHRLSIAGFQADAAAASACRTIKAQGGSCFVRANAGDTPLRFASRSSGKV